MKFALEVLLLRIAAVTALPINVPAKSRSSHQSDLNSFASIERSSLADADGTIEPRGDGLLGDIVEQALQKGRSLADTPTGTLQTLHFSHSESARFSYLDLLLNDDVAESSWHSPSQAASSAIGSQQMLPEITATNLKSLSSQQTARTFGTLAGSTLGPQLPVEKLASHKVFKTSEQRRATVRKSYHKHKEKITARQRLQRALEKATSVPTAQLKHNQYVRRWRQKQKHIAEQQALLNPDEPKPLTSMQLYERARNPLRNKRKAAKRAEVKRLRDAERAQASTQAPSGEPRSGTSVSAQPSSSLSAAPVEPAEHQQDFTMSDARQHFSGPSAHPARSGSPVQSTLEAAGAQGVSAAAERTESGAASTPSYPSFLRDSPSPPIPGSPLYDR